MTLVAQHSAETHRLSVPCGYLSFITILLFQEGPVPIWACIKKEEL